MKALRRLILASSLPFLVNTALCEASPGAPKQGPKPEDVAEPEAKTSAKQQEQILALIEQLVFEDKPASKEPPEGPRINNNDPAYIQRYEACQKAFHELSKFKEAAFPLLVQHLDDPRQSIPFRNHSMGFTVGDACKWNLYYQLMDQPEDYSSYGYSRKGRDGEQHPKPYWGPDLFDEAGGIKAWLETNKDLSYQAKQIKCLTWLLTAEKAIGACDAESYFENILPLEVRILERRLEAGEKVAEELKQAREAMEKKSPADVPKELLPDKAK